MRLCDAIWAATCLRRPDQTSYPVGIAGVSGGPPTIATAALDVEVLLRVGGLCQDSSCSFSSHAAGGPEVQAHTHAPSAIFGQHIRYVVPLFQRPYVWNRDDQWRPLWEDVRNVTERILEGPAQGFGGQGVAPHFLGAIVLDQQLNPTAFIGVRHIIDGQQRLTTLQLLLDAAQWVVEQHGSPMDAQALRVLVLNDKSIAQHDDDVFKVWPTDRDQDAFRASMDNDVQVPKELATSRITQAHTFFVEQITAWAMSNGADAAAERLHALVLALREHLRLVVIDLEPGDNAQVIFETLNHRGAPLLAADLVKNLVFQLIQAQQGDVRKLYDAYWSALDSDYWRQLVAQGRMYRPRIDLFLNYWLTMKLLHEVPTDRVFSDFRDYVVGTKPDIAALLKELSDDAKVYEQMEKLAPDTVEGRFHYRVIRALDTAAVGPFLLWLLRYSEADMPVEQRHKALQSVESWLVRRALCRATAKDVNRTVLDMLKELERHGPAVAGDTIETFLNGQTADSRYWPTDDMVQQSMAVLPLYKNLTRPRLRMLLEALEDARRGPLGEGQLCPRNLTVEHVMPQAWREYWGSDVKDDEIAQLHRDQLIHTLGNLTLVNGKLNPALSNRPWTDADAPESKGKRSYLLEHSELKLNADLVKKHEAAWTEQDIRSRTTKLVERLAAIWARPAPVDPPSQIQEKEPEEEPELAVAPEADMESHTGKYKALSAWLATQDQDEVRLSFGQVEEVLGFELPPSARNHLPHWYGYEGTALGRAIRDAGWKASLVNLTDERVTFVRQLE